MASIDETADAGRRVPPTDVRFGTRALLFTMVAVAFAAALLGSVLRKIPVERQILTTATCGVVAATLVGCFGYVAWRRRRLELRAGPPRFVLIPHSYLFPRTPRLAANLVGLTAILYSVAMLAFADFMLGEQFSGRANVTLVWNTIYAVAGIAFGISVLWWNRGIRLCDNGLLLRNKIVPWNKIQRWYWDGCYRDVIVLDTWLAVRVPAEQRAEVESFIAERVAAARAAIICGRHASSKLA
ncbi:MAG: hypothetical protein AB7G28_24170 [Pirellulales bacterium]